MMVYAASTQVLQEATTDRALAVAAIEKASRMESAEAAFFNEGIFQAAEQLTKGKNPSSRRVIIWLTDDVPNSFRGCRPAPLSQEADGESTFPTGRPKHLLQTSTVVCSLVKKSDQSAEGESRLMSHRRKECCILRARSTNMPRHGRPGD